MGTMADAEIQHTLSPVGDTEPAEIRELTQTLHDALAGRSEVDTIRPATGAAPPGAKVGEALTLASLLIQLAPAAIQGVLGLARDILSRPGTPPTRVSVVIGKRSVEVEFDPNKTTPDEIAGLAEKLRKNLKDD